MRIVIDMQGAQSLSSRNRGIGRYVISIVQAIVHHRNDHEIFLALNGLFPESVDSITTRFDRILPSENIRIWYPPAGVSFTSRSSHFTAKSAEIIRNFFLASLSPDVLYVTSLFEGFNEDVVVDICSSEVVVPTAVTLFDLIPYIHPDPYLKDKRVASWYLEKIQSLQRADLSLAISESSRLEAIHHLGLPEDTVVNISTDANDFFREVFISTSHENYIRSQYNIHKPFVMYTGGIDVRKNIEGLIVAFSALPEQIKADYILVIVCSIKPETRISLRRLIDQLGLQIDSVIFTGFVPDDDLRALYNLCSLFVFPSFHEGFGLPVLEAMRCRAPVIASNTSSLPEVVCWTDALFDPYSTHDISQHIFRALTDNDFRIRLIENSITQRDKFSWDQTGKDALLAMEKLYRDFSKKSAKHTNETLRPRLAYISPLPPVKSGIADYSANLLPSLSKHYEIEVIVAQEVISDAWIVNNCPIRSIQWFKDNALSYQRILYHFGNSDFHQHMFGLLRDIPGVVVLHDFYLSGALRYMDLTCQSPGCWARELYISHGYKALYEYYHSNGSQRVLIDYPCSLSVIQNSLGLIAHSSNIHRLTSKFYGDDVTDWSIIPLARDTNTITDKYEARRALGFNEDDFIVCSFGVLGPAKLNHRLLQAWYDSMLSRTRKCRLLFVGMNHSGRYGKELLSCIESSTSSSSIEITGWVDQQTYHNYLAAADLCVQLRSFSRGESSAAVLDAMNYSLPVIVNANGSMADFDDNTVLKLPDEFTNEQLVAALELLWKDDLQRLSMGSEARKILLQHHDTQFCADLYKVAIEDFYQRCSSSLPGLLSDISSIAKPTPNKYDLASLAFAISKNFPPRNKRKQLFLDVTEFVNGSLLSQVRDSILSLLRTWIQYGFDGYRVEPIYLDTSIYRYAYSSTAELFGWPKQLFNDDPIEIGYGDIYIGLDLCAETLDICKCIHNEMRCQGVLIKLLSSSTITKSLTISDLRAI